MKRVAGKTQITYPYILYSFCCVLRAQGIMLQKRRRRLQNGPETEFDKRRADLLENNDAVFQ